MNSRALALRALVSVDEGAYSNIVLPRMLRSSSLSARDRAFVTDLVYGTLRARRALDHLIARVVDRPLDALDASVLDSLRLGAYQLVHGVPAHAAVGETVTVAPRRARGYVNAVLRAISAAGPPWDPPDHGDRRSLAVRLSFPDWVVDTFLDEFGVDDGRAALERANEPAPVTLRPNRSVTTRRAVAAELASLDVEAEAGTLVPEALVVRGIGDPARIPVVAEGRATPQDQASQAVVDVLDPRPGDTVLDVAAAPGGKASAAGERVGASGLVLASDLRPGRARLVAAAVERLGLPSVSVLVADGRALPTRPGSADRVLVDAPCTGLGVLRRRPEARWRIALEDVDRLARLQRELLAAAARAVRPDGVVVYSVCTVTREETRAVDEWAAAELPELVPETPAQTPWRPWGRGALLLPHDADTDGMFVMRFRRVPAEHAR